MRRCPECNNELSRLIDTEKQVHSGLFSCMVCGENFDSDLNIIETEQFERQLIREDLVPRFFGVISEEDRMEMLTEEKCWLCGDKAVKKKTCVDCGKELRPVCRKCSHKKQANFCNNMNIKK